MPEKNEKAQRKEILFAQRDEKRRLIREGLPVPPPWMKALFDYIDGHLASSECDDTLRLARESLRTKNLPEEPVVSWPENAGGYCDCEAISNAEGLLEDAVPGYRDLPPPDAIRG
jgi:Protein of unknown function (DUF2695)